MNYKKHNQHVIDYLNNNGWNLKAYEIYERIEQKLLN
jgi:hypothetical protein